MESKSLERSEKTCSTKQMNENSSKLNYYDYQFPTFGMHEWKWLVHKWGKNWQIKYKYCKFLIPHKYIHMYLVNNIVFLLLWV